MEARKDSPQTRQNLPEKNVSSTNSVCDRLRKLTSNFSNSSKEAFKKTSRVAI